VNITNPSTVGGSVETFPRDDQSVSEQLQQVRAAALVLLRKAETAGSATDMATAVEKAAAALKLATEIGKTHADLAKVNEELLSLKRANKLAPKRERSERIRDYVAALAPLVAIITLAATLFAQSWQFLRSERSKREDALNARWQDAVKTISASGALSPAIVSLQPFLRSPEYATQAREAAINLLANASDSTFFTSLFGPTFAPISWANIGDVIRLDRALAARSGPLASKSWDGKINDMSRLTKDEAASYQYIESVVPTITAQIGNVLKTPKPPGSQVDLSATFLKNGDWQGVNLDGVNLENTGFLWINIRNVDLTNVTNFTGANFYGTAWWEAKAINRPLLEYLKASYPYREENYSGDKGFPGLRPNAFNQAAYDAALVRLTSQLK
jgi:pentapeptide repeat protein